MGQSAISAVGGPKTPWPTHSERIVACDWRWHARISALRNRKRKELRNCGLYDGPLDFVLDEDGFGWKKRTI
jgi:hypothetical protein